MMSSTGENIRKFRRLNNWTQKQLAEKVNVSPQVVSNWERGYSGLDNDDIKELSRVFRVSADEIVGNDGKQTDLEPMLLLQQLKSDIRKFPKEYQGKLLEEWKEWRDLMPETDDFFSEIDLSDEELINKYSFTYKNKTIPKEKIAKILSFIRFVAQEEE